MNPFRTAAVCAALTLGLLWALGCGDDPSSVAKFCNNLKTTSGSLNLTLVVGDTSFSASTGKCSGCTEVKSGGEVSVKLEIPGQGTVLSGKFTNGVPADKQLMFMAELDGTSQPTVTVYELKAGVSCDTANPFN